VPKDNRDTVHFFLRSSRGDKYSKENAIENKPTEAQSGVVGVTCNLRAEDEGTEGTGTQTHSTLWSHTDRTAAWSSLSKSPWQPDRNWFYRV
jgi:hypothetical protein